MKILFLSNWFSYPPVNGSKIRTYHLIRELARDHDLSLIAFCRTFSIPEIEPQRAFL